MTERLLIDRNVAVPMRDGTLLRADVYRPDTPTPVPAIVVRLPYDKDSLLNHTFAIHPVRAAEAGYAVVYQDTRGRFKSEGDFYPFVHEGRDGYDTVEWVAAQPWCSGAVGMSGASYFGATQWLAAAEQPPHLKALCPIVTTSEYYEGWTYQGGAFQLGFALLWTLNNLAPENARRLSGAEEMMRLLTACDHIDEHYRHTALADLPVLRESGAADFYADWIAHAANDEYWQSTAINRRYQQVVVPAYNIGGWYDLFLHGTLENYVGMRQQGGTQAARSGQRLLVGPWAHGAFSGQYADFDFGVAAAADVVDLTGVQLAFFAGHLKGEETDFQLKPQLQQPPVRIFVMGENRWRDEQEWPLARAEASAWYLHSAPSPSSPRDYASPRDREGDADSNGGGLSPTPPGDEAPDFYLYDPRHPTPTIGGPTFLPGLLLGANAGPRDQRPAEARPDVLTYTSHPLDQPVEVTGPLTVTLYAATSAPDTDFVARLCDVYPDGASRILAEGILRARFRQGCDQPRALEPSRVYEYKIYLVATSNVFLPGHCIRVDVTSSSFPRFDPNPNTGNPLGQDDLRSPRDVRPALQTIFHDSQYPSHILLPIIPR